MNSFFCDTVLPMYFRTIRREDTKTMILKNVGELENYCGKDFLHINNGDVRQYGEHLLAMAKSGERSIKYMAKKFSLCRSVATFIEEASGKGMLAISYDNPFTGYVFASVSADVIANSVPGNEDIDRLLSYCSATDEELFVAITLILRLSLTSGEVVGIKREDINRVSEPEEFFVLAVRKGHDARFLRLPSDVSKIVLDYMTEHIADDSGSLLVNRNGDRLILRTLQSRFKKAAAAIDFPYAYSMNDIRNASIAYMLACGASGGEVSQFTGVSERWMHRYTHTVKHMSIQSNDYSNIKVVK